MVRCGQERAGERMASFSCLNCFFKKLSIQKKDGAAPPHENSNNPLAVNPKAKMMRPLELFLQIFYCG
jgi:hypothetical protein